MAGLRRGSCDSGTGRESGLRAGRRPDLINALLSIGPVWAGLSFSFSSGTGIWKLTLAGFLVLDLRLDLRLLALSTSEDRRDGVGVFLPDDSNTISGVMRPVSSPKGGVIRLDGDIRPLWLVRPEGDPRPVREIRPGGGARPAVARPDEDLWVGVVFVDPEGETPRVGVVCPLDSNGFGDALGLCIRAAAYSGILGTGGAVSPIPLPYPTIRIS